MLVGWLCVNKVDFECIMGVISCSQYRSGDVVVQFNILVFYFKYGGGYDGIYVYVRVQLIGKMGLFIGLDGYFLLVVVGIVEVGICYNIQVWALIYYCCCW